MLRRRTVRRDAEPRPALSRRDFLAASGLGAAALGAGMGGAGLVRRAEAQGETPGTATVKRKTICPYCSVGCAIWAEVQNGVWTGQEPVFESPINQGTHCAKGAATRELALGERRLKYPMRKEGGQWVRISWDEAIKGISSELLRIREEYGPDSAYWLGSAKHPNEVAYLLRKFAALWGTNNIDHQARICHSTTVAGVANTFGYGAMTNTFNDIRNSKSIIIIGGNPAEAHPVSMLHVLNGKENGAKMIVVDPRFTRTAAHADEYVRIRPGADIGFMWGLLRVILENGWEDREMLDQRAWGFDEVAKECERWTLEEVERVCGIPPEQTERVARTLAENRPGTLVWCMGLTQSTVGSSKTRAASILQLALGNMGVSGGGANIFRGHTNVQGATDLGVSVDTLPAYYGLAEGAWKHWCRVWDLDYEWVKGRFASKELMERPGIPVSRYLDGILEDSETLEQPAPLKAMTFWGHAANSVTRGPDQLKALTDVELLVVIDPVPTSVSIMTEKQDNVYLLPAGTPMECYGSVTNSSRSVQWREKVFEPLFEAKSDYEIATMLADALGFGDQLLKSIDRGFGETMADDLLREINRGTWTIGYTGQSPERLRRHMDNMEKFDSVSLIGREDPVKGEYFCLPWPAWGPPEAGHPGTPLLYDTSKSVAEGGLPFRARWGVQHEGENLLAEDSFTRGSEIEDGYPEITLGMLDALGWASELTAREKLVNVAIAADRFRLDMLEIPEDEARAALRQLEREAARGQTQGDASSELPDTDGAWQNSSNDKGNSENESERSGGSEDEGPTDAEIFPELFPNYPERALTAIEAYLANNPQDESKDLTLRQKLLRMNWKTDLSGGLQRVAIAHGLAPYGNGKARCVVWTFPDPVPLHREPLFTPRRDLLPEYETYADRQKWRLPVLFRTIQEVNYADEFPLALTSGRLVEYEGGGDETRSNKWLAEFQQHMFAEINPADAEAAGIDPDTDCWVRTPVGGVRVRALVTRRVGPGTVFMPFHFSGRWMGQDWTGRYPEGSVPYVVGEATNTVQTYGYDAVTQMQETKATLCRVERAGEDA